MKKYRLYISGKDKFMLKAAYFQHEYNQNLIWHLYMLIGGKDD